MQPPGNLAVHNDRFTSYSSAYTPLPPGKHSPVGHYDNIVIRPSAQTSGEQVITHNLVIDSRDRDAEKYPCPNDYVIYFDTPFRDVLSLELLNIAVPKSSPNVNASNDTVLFQETQDQVDNGTYTEARVERGQYAIEELCTAVSDSMTAASTTGTSYTAQTNVNSTLAYVPNKLTITATGGSGVFGLFNGVTPGHYYPGNMMRALGFRPRNVQASNGVLNSDYNFDLSGEDYLIMNIEGISNNFGTNNALQGSFAQIILKDVDYNETVHVRAADLGRCYARFNPMMCTLARMHITFKTRSGRLYDFENRDHVMIMELRCKFRTRDY